ncbi:thioredoxin family protein, partial [Striga asiatica]
MSEVEVEVDDVGAILEALVGAEAGDEPAVEEGVGRDAKGPTVDTAGLDTLVDLDVVVELFGHYLGCATCVLLRPRSEEAALEHAPLAGGGHREGARIPINVLTPD